MLLDLFLVHILWTELKADTVFIYTPLPTFTNVTQQNVLLQLCPV